MEDSAVILTVTLNGENHETTSFCEENFIEEIDYSQDHFLFNALNSIKGMIILNKPNVSDLINEFGTYLHYQRTVQKMEPNPLVSFEQEKKALLAYSNLEMARYGKLAIALNLKPIDFPVPAMVIQSYLHGIIRYSLKKKYSQITVIGENVESSLSKQSYKLDFMVK